MWDGGSPFHSLAPFMQRTIYVHVDGSDLSEYESELMSAFGRLNEDWQQIGAVLVNEKHPKDPSMLPSDMPDWYIGINVSASFFGRFHIDRLLPFLQDLAAATDLEFVVGIVGGNGISEDVAFIDIAAGEQERQLLYGLVDCR